MQSTIIELAMYAVAAWTWVWLVRITHRYIFIAIYVQQRLGVRTPTMLHWLLGREWWLAAGGIVAGVVAGLAPELRPAIGLGVLAAAIVLLTFANAGMARLLDPRVIKAIFDRLGGGPNDPPPAPSLMDF